MTDKEIIERYSNGARGLPQVCDPRRRPWVVLTGYDSEAITNQVEACPSGALSIEQGAKK